MADQSDGKANSVKEVFEELFSLLENLESQNAAVVAFLKDQQIATDERLAPYLEQAGNAASVRWRAARVRMEHLLSPIPAAVLDRDPAKPAPDEKEASNKASEEKENPKVQKQKNAEEKTTPRKAGDANPTADKTATFTKGQSRNQQSTAPENADQPQAKDTKESDSDDTENKKTASAATSVPATRDPIGPGAIAPNKGAKEEQAEANKPA